jgi:Cu/Ag efflux pump CusA
MMATAMLVTALISVMLSTDTGLKIIKLMASPAVSGLVSARLFKLILFRFYITGFAHKSLKINL